jgi:hypothetical protein
MGSRTPQIGRKVRRIALVSRSVCAAEIRRRWPNSEYYSTFEIAKLAGVNPDRIHLWIFRGYLDRPNNEVPSRLGQYGRALVWHISDLDKILALKEWGDQHPHTRDDCKPGAFAKAADIAWAESKHNHKRKGVKA